MLKRGYKQKTKQNETKTLGSKNFKWNKIKKTADESRFNTTADESSLKQQQNKK